MRFAGQGLVAQPKWDVNPVMDEIPRRINPRTGKLEPINKPEIPHGWPDTGGGPVHGDMRGRDWGGNPVSNEPVGGSGKDWSGKEIAGGSWLTPYRKEWIRHTSGQQPITDPVRRKELQDIILYPERVMGV